jgi:hypothetical protein
MLGKSIRIFDDKAVTFLVPKHCVPVLSVVHYFVRFVQKIRYLLKLERHLVLSVDSWRHWFRMLELLLGVWFWGQDAAALAPAHINWVRVTLLNVAFTTTPLPSIRLILVTALFTLLRPMIELLHRENLLGGDIDRGTFDCFRVGAGSRRFWLNLMVGFPFLLFEVFHMMIVCLRHL